MSWFIDATAIVALAGLELDWAETAAMLDQDTTRLWSPMSRWEGIVGTRNRLSMSPDDAEAEVMRIARINAFEMIAIGVAEADAAVDAMRRYGKASGHRAQLNMGDCFAYACAQTNKARLLYKGNDFSHTDMAL